MRTLSQRTSRYENDPLLPRQHERPGPRRSQLGGLQYSSFGSSRARRPDVDSPAQVDLPVACIADKLVSMPSRPRARRPDRRGAQRRHDRGRTSSSADRQALSRCRPGSRKCDGSAMGVPSAPVRDQRHHRGPDSRPRDASDRHESAARPGSAGQMLREGEIGLDRRSCVPAWRIAR